MDSLTHIVIGACIGEAFFERGFGKKAMVWGLLAQSIPDIDFVTSFWMSPSSALLAHRGFTHSILFALIIIPFFSFIAIKIHPSRNITKNKWLLFFTTEVFLHLFLDAFNNYGIGWFEPFSHQRISFNIIYVADPFFSIIPFVAFCLLIILKKYDLSRTIIWKLGLIFPFIYLSYCTFNKIVIDKNVRDNMKQLSLHGNDYFSTPTPLQNWLWYIVIKDEDRFLIGYKSLFDTYQKIKFQTFFQYENLIDDKIDTLAFKKLKRFSKGFFILQNHNDTVTFNDLRFGQILGWHYPQEKFVFSYSLNNNSNNRMLVQRGRFAKWNSEEFIFYLKRISGNQFSLLK